MKPLQLAAAVPAPVVHVSSAPRPIVPQVVQQNAVPPVAPAPQTVLQMHAGWLTHGIAGIFILCAVGLVLLLAIQTTKQEGLSGTIGGRVESAYHSRVGAEEQLKRLTGVVAVGFVVTAFILSLTGI